MSLAITVLFYFAAFVLVVGLAYRIWVYAKVPAPLRIATTPAPVTKGGVVLRMFREVAFFESLFKSNKLLWLFAVLFHFGLLLVLIRHLRYFINPVPTIVELMQPFGKYAAFAMIVGLLGLWARRFVIDRVRYISAPSDHLILALLVLIGISGASMTFVSHVDIVGLKEFTMGLLTFDAKPLPSDFLLVIHLMLVAVLMIIFPYSKLLHGVGVFFSPTRNQVDNPREKRHIVKWARKFEEES
ncbi:MAG TPA: nitrate reductase [Thiolapillus brandeum]|uniref:Nitrate reductase n=1 Tax=Thiolapillus brandeum TaxID=1076588 RepID=A0A831JX63_9GAMM|nr:nitrate reductase [Thiolapillus brandeum]